MHLYMMLYISSFFLALNADDWFLIWLALEVNMIVFVVMIYNRYSLKHIESCLKYFFVQSLSSGLFISIFYLNKNLLEYFGSLVLSCKIGGGPFFFWFPSVAEGISWLWCFILFSLQKIIPMMLMVMFMSIMMWVVIMISLMVGVIGSFNQSHIKRLMAFSSVHHIGWMMMCSVVDSSFWMNYLLIYMMVTLSIIFTMMFMEVEDLNGINKFKSKWSFMLSLLSLGGMPPFLGFYLKWMAFDLFLKLNYWVIVFMIIMSVVMFYVYARIIYNVVVGCGMEMVWMNYYLNSYIMKYESMSLLGLMMGCLLGFIMMF